MSDKPPLAEKSPLCFRGAAWKLLHSHAQEILISGPAGTGKSTAMLAKLHLCADSVPNVRALLVRKTRASLTESGLVTWESGILPPGHPALYGPTRAHRRAYHYPNGSEVVVAGLDKVGRVMSSEYDLIAVQEAIELEEAEWEGLTTRLRNGKLPFQQLMADTNPDRPTHWLKKRCDAGRCLMLESRHEDNPVLWDEAAQAWTWAAHRPDGTGYIDRLDQLTGPRKARLRHGKWVQAEGVVYEAWDAARHVIDRFDIPADWPRYLTIDFGFTNPFTCQWWAEDPDGRLFLYRELYQTQLLVEDAAREILALSQGEPRPRAVICDHDAEDRATLERHLGVATVAAIKDVSPGIQAVAVRLRPAGDSRPRLFVLRDSLVRRDPALVEAKKPTCLIEEVDGYVWDTSNNRKQGEEPVKKDDHSLDAARYLVSHVDQPEPLMDFIFIPRVEPYSPPQTPSELKYPQVRWFAPSCGWQPLPVLNNEVVRGCPDFRSEHAAGYFLHAFYRLVGAPLPSFPCPELPAEDAEQVESKARDFARCKGLLR
jgi:phage terminase large subunit